MEEEKRKISKQTFQERILEAKKVYSDNKKSIKLKHKNNNKSKSEQEIYVLNKKYKNQLKINKNRYALIYNSIKNEELYRKGALEVKISDLKNRYKKRKNTLTKFNEEEEKTKLKESIKKIKIDYSKPISRHYRKNRTKKDDNATFITLPIDTPLKRNVKSILLIILAAFLATLAMDIFVKPFGIYSAGLRGVTQTIFYALQKNDPKLPQFYSHLLFIGFNIPLAIFGLKAIGKKFTLFTLSFLAVQYLFSMLIFDFAKVDELIKPFGLTNESIKNIYVLNKKVISSTFEHALPIVSALIGSTIYGAAVGLLYKAGGSTGGSKFIVTWFSVKKGISIGKIAIMISLFVVFQGILVNKVILNHENFITSFTSVTLFATLIFAFASNSVLDMVFAKSKKEIVSVVTDKKDEIMRFLDVKYMYNRTFRVGKIKTNFHKRQKYEMEFLVSKTETNSLIKIFTQLDDDALVTTTPVSKARGKIYSQWFE